jgi:hypothetical protein
MTENTTNRNWTLPVVEGSEGEWGLILNENTFEEIDQDVQDILDDVGAAGGIAALNDQGTVMSGQIPDLAITNVQVFSSTNGLTGWSSAEQGDVGVVDGTDTTTAYIFTGGDPSVLDNWSKIKVQEPPVTEVFGRTGTIQPQSGDYSVSDITDAASQSDTTDPSEVDSTNWGDYEIQVNGTDGSGIINFKT